MTIRTADELKNTRDKLALLEKTCREMEAEAAPDAYVRSLTLRSLKQFINRLKEEIARFDAGVRSAG